jgi:hypothetical protein
MMMMFGMLRWGRMQHRGQGDRRHSRRLRYGLEVGCLAVRRWAPPFFDGVTFRTYLLHELMTLPRVAGRLGVNSARGGYERDESHCRENRFHRWSSMSPHSGVASTTRAERFARVAISMTGLWAEHLDPAQSTPLRAGLMKITQVECDP